MEYDTFTQNQGMLFKKLSRYFIMKTQWKQFSRTLVPKSQTDRFLSLEVVSDALRLSPCEILT